MKKSYYIKQAIILLVSCLYFLMNMFVPMASGGVALIAVVFAPISFATGMLMLVFQKLAYVYASKRTQSVTFYVFVLLQIGFAVITFPYRT